ALHPHGIGKQTHRAGIHSRHMGYGLFHPGAAGRAAHTRYGILLHLTTPHFSMSYFISFCSVSTSSSMVSSFPSRISSATQVRIWLASSTLLKLFSAALTAET